MMWTYSQFIVACVVFILPNKIQPDVRVPFKENKTEAAGERGWVLVGSQSRRSMERARSATILWGAGGGVI
jgi:hypothetical protein